MAAASLPVAAVRAITPSWPVSTLRRSVALEELVEGVGVVGHLDQERAVHLGAVRLGELEIERLVGPAEHLRQERLGGVDLGVAVAVLLDDGGVDAERHVVDEEAVRSRWRSRSGARSRHGRRTGCCGGRRDRCRGRARSGCGCRPRRTRTGPRTRRRSTPRGPGSRRRPPCRGSRRRARWRHGRVARGRARGRASRSRRPARWPARPGRTARPCRLPTTGCRSAPGGWGG